MIRVGNTNLCHICSVQCFRHSELEKDRPTTAQFREKLPWFLNTLPSADCSKGGHGAYTTSVELKGRIDSSFHLVTNSSRIVVQYPFHIQVKTVMWKFLCAAAREHMSSLSILLFIGYEGGVIQASSFRTYHTPLNKQVCVTDVLSQYEEGTLIY